jgi:hypothetical protein
MHGAVLDHFLPPARAAPSPPATPDPDSFAGFYEYASPRFAQLAGFDRLLENVWLDADGARALKDGILGRDDRDRPFLFLPPTAYLERASQVVYWCRAVVLGLAGIAALTLPVHLVIAARRRRPYVAPLLLGLFWLALAAIAAALFFVRTSEQALRLNVMTGALFVGTILLYIAGTCAPFAVVSALRRHRAVTDWSMLAAAVGVAVLAQTLLAWGWIGIKMWDRAVSILN